MPEILCDPCHHVAPGYEVRDHFEEAALTILVALTAAALNA